MVRNGFLKLISGLTGDNQYETLAKSEDFQKVKKKGGITMCNVLEYHKEEGKIEERNNLIIQMYKEGLPSEQIARITRLSVEEVEHIRDSATNEEC